jgi:DNA-binding transcriptional LysR family regulator
VDWNDLRHFLAVARARTLAAAARELGVEHTTVGRRLAALESALGTKLFTRGPDGFTLTDAGAEILAHAEEVARRIDAIERRAIGCDARVEGVVRLTTSEALSGYFVRRLASLRAKHPALTVEILSGNRSFDLRRGEADVAVRAASLDDADLVARKCVVAAWSLYAAPAYVERKGPLHDADAVAGHDVIDFDATMSAVPGAQWLREHGKGANVVLRGNSIVSVVNAAIFGMGVAAIPCFIGDTERGLVRLTKTCVGKRDVYVVVHPDLAKVARVRAVVDFVVDAFAQDRALWMGEGAITGGS